MTDEVDQQDPVAVTTSIVVVYAKAVLEGQGIIGVCSLVIPEPEQEQWPGYGPTGNTPRGF